MTDAITQGLSYTVTSDLFGETRINLNGLTAEQVGGLFGVVDDALASGSRNKQGLEPVIIALYGVLEDLANDPKATP